MAGIIHWIKTTFFPGNRPRLSPEELQAAFKARYRNFRALLTANNNALEAMAEMEQALQTGQTYGMAFVRAHSTAVMVNVYKMIQHLTEMSDGRYHQLATIFEHIKDRLDTILEKVPPAHGGEWIIPMAKIDRNMADQVGKKMANLGEVAGLDGIKTPQGFAITISASSHFLSSNKLRPEINRLLQMLDPENLAEVYKARDAIQQLITKSPLPADLEEQIYSAYAELEKETHDEVTVAMRSSALGEDLAGASFAGQYHTELNVHREFLGQAYKKILASKYTSRAILYRLKKGYRHQDIEMCVGCLAMVDAVVSGVIYSRDPANPASSWATLSVVRGTAQNVMDWSSAPDLFQLSRQSPYKILHHQAAKNTNGPEPVSVAPVILSEEQAAGLTQTALMLENHFDSPQDVDWSINSQGEIIILQSSPMIAGIERSDNDTNQIGMEAAEHPLLRGLVTSSPGVASGPVYLVRSSQDLLLFPKGAVLVVEHPLPEWAPLLTKAVALIGETGSVACHLATVAREFGIPAIFRVADALNTMANGQIITVDAGSQLIHAGRREDLLVQAVQLPDLMAGSPVQALLRNLLTHITPLNLTDPASPFFKSTHCETLHDITRFCHEKSVVEMFTFGEKNHFDQGTAKRLVGDVPLDWWVINLADGFREGTDPTLKAIRIEDIVSTPMIAIWEGIAAFPWLGPPAVSVRGFSSILFQSTMQPGIDPGVASPLTAKNYFLISKNFCHLSVRLGYHFAMIEAYLSDLRTESYVAFTFKGGAADARRKAGRVALLSEILTLYGFRIEQKGDALTARVEKRPIEFLQQRLKIIGYLSLHARQIDMVMNSQASVNHYREKFLSEINTILSPPDTKHTDEELHG